MTWRTAASSVVGTAHAARNEPCQDACRAVVFTDSKDHEVLATVVADGAGSARHGGDGATFAVEESVRLWRERVRRSATPPDAAVIGDFLLALRDGLKRLAAATDASLRDYACTYVAVLAWPDAAVCIHIGDGAIVGDMGNGPEVLSGPMNGEYANTTYFITDPEPSLAGGVTWIGQRLVRVAAFTDGLQMFALAAGNDGVNPKFFGRRFQTLEQASEDQLPQLDEALCGFLQSSMITRHTDDDLTLVLATRTDE
jgi:hypothetical protein